MGGYSFTAGTTVEPKLQKRPTEKREDEVGGEETLGRFGALRRGGVSTALIAVVEEYRRNNVVDKNEGSIELLVDDKVSEYYLDDRPGLRQRRSDYSRLKEPHKITIAGNRSLKRVVTGIIRGCIIDQTGVKQRAGLSAVAVPGIERNLFSVPSTTEKGATHIFALEDSRIETNVFITPLQHVGESRDLCTVSIELKGIELALHAEETTDQWHRCMGRIEARSLELLNKTDASSVGFRRGVSPWEDHLASSPEEVQPRDHHACSASPHRLHGSHFATVHGGLEIRQKYHGCTHQIQGNLPCTSRDHQGGTREPSLATDGEAGGLGKYVSPPTAAPVAVDRAYQEFPDEKDGRHIKHIITIII